MGSLYGHCLKNSNKWYIGITLGNRTPEQRWGKNGYSYLTFSKGRPNNPKFRNAILKYGWNNFEHIIFFENIEDSEAKQLEKEYIKKYNSIKNGYNCTEGGDGICGVKFSEETRRKISERNKSNKELIEKFKKCRIGKTSGIAKKVLCVETGQIYPSARNASISIGLNPDAVKCAIRRNTMCKKMHWKRLDKEQSLPLKLDKIKKEK